MQGWISIHRQLNDHWLWKDKPFSKGQAWVDILLRVNHKQAKVPIGNELIDVGEGQTIWSIKDMSEKWGWSRKKVSNFLNILQTESMLSQKRTSKYTLLTVENWTSYQTEEHQKNIKGTSKEHQKHTNNNDNNKNNDIYTLKYALDSEERRLTDLLISLMVKNNEYVKVPDTDEKIDKWCIHIDRLIRIDKATPQVVANVINWCQSDSFWKNNILSTSKLREKFPNLYGKYKDSKITEKIPTKSNNKFHDFNQRENQQLPDMMAKFNAKH